MFTQLTKENLHRQAPSIFTEGSAERTSNKYQHISTIKVVEGLIKEGFVPVKAMQAFVRLADKRNFTKHMIRFRHIDSKPSAGGLFPEIILINSHDGLSSYRLMSGLYRLVCSNGLVAGQTYEQLRVRHQGDIIGNVIQGTYRVIENSKKMLQVADEMGAIRLNHHEKQIFAEAAHTIRFDDSDLGKGIDPLALLSPKRSAEVNKNDLFTIFNVAQENLIKGGVRGYATDKNGRRIRRIRTREIKGIDQNTALNRALWTLTEKMLELRRS